MNRYALLVVILALSILLLFVTTVTGPFGKNALANCINQLSYVVNDFGYVAESVDGRNAVIKIIALLAAITSLLCIIVSKPQGSH